MATDDPIRVLHVEDDSSFAATASRFLTAEADLDVAVEHDAEAGLDRVRNGDRVDCVVSDYDMPGMDGLAFLERIRDTRPDLPFILFTGKGSEEVARDALRAGATDYLRKHGGADKLAVLANRVTDAVEKQRTERRLSEFQDRYRTLVETAPVPVAVHSDREMVYVNPTAVEFLAAESREELLGENVVDFVHPEDRSTARDHIAETIREGRSDTVEERLIDLDGTVRHVLIAASRTTYEGKPAIQTVAQDVTERRERQRELERQRDRFSALFENVPDPAVNVRYDEAARPIVVDVNSAFEEVFGYDAGTVRGESIDEYLVPPDQGEEAEAYNRRIQAGESLHAEVCRETTDGRREFLLSIVPSRAGDDATEGFAIYTDITERKRRERKLAALHEATRDLMDAETIDEVATLTVEAANDVLDIPFSGVFLTDGESTLQPAALSEKAEERFGEPEPLRSGESVAWAVYESGEPFATDDVRDHENVANPETDVRSELIIPLGEHGVLQAGSTTVGSFTDTDRSLASVLAANAEAGLRRAERETALRERRRQVERQNEQLEEFANVVSHDLRNPLEQARGYLGIARRAETPDPGDLERVAEGLDRIDEIISDVLTLARQGGEVEETEPVDLELIALECADMVSDDVDVVVEDPPEVWASEGGLRQLLENLFRNVTEHADTAEEIRVGSLDDGFFVADDGVGIDPGKRDQVFTSGYTTESDGTGFGLTIVQEVASGHDWSVDVTESEGGGARFEVTGAERVTRD